MWLPTRLTRGRIPWHRVPVMTADWLHGVRILIVEDDAAGRELLRQIVESLGATARVAEEGHEALAIAAEWTPDLILADLKMPGMDGYSLRHAIEQDPKLRGVRVVAVSGLSTDEDLRRTWLAGFDGHIVKPLDYDLVAALLERVFWAHRRT